MTLERDMELVFEVLRKIVNSDHEEIYGKIIGVNGYSQEKIGYHLYLMDQAGLIEASVSKSTSGPLWEEARFIEMKWEGYEFLDALQNDSVFHKFKDVLSEKGKSIPFKIAQELLMKISANYFLET